MQEEIDGMADVYGDLNDFESRLRNNQTNYKNAAQNDDSSEEEALEYKAKNRNDPVVALQEKNQILMDRLYKSEKQLGEMKDTFEAIVGKSDSLKDKKIIELSKKNRALQLQSESLKTKAAKAAGFALDLKKEADKKDLTKVIEKTQKE